MQYIFKKDFICNELTWNRMEKIKSLMGIFKLEYPWFLSQKYIDHERILLYATLTMQKDKILTLTVHNICTVLISWWNKSDISKYCKGSQH